ncbi:hypothetical protein FHU38_003358 [Saccharomonospora amisosensis]|uniref:Uncharacterized protein n=1 Tax=Saccharomonospora amisosensis TaxID=1128677 RepID=A0A7X5ZRL6_9PSEU|nr:hypothetical protein [Saccharomonospora amisosensis]NIJ13014.1 hypothetical protein [Saccharomonospora amisosensis]
MPGPVVDTPSAQEFVREISGRMPMAELQVIAADVERKSELMRELLSEPAALDRAGLRLVLRNVFGTRRQADSILDAVTPNRLAAAIDDLLYSEGGLARRFERFDAVLAPCTDRGFDLPGELLHFTFPDRYWLWTRWVWDPAVETGALRLVVTDDVDLQGASSRGETYLSVGQAMAFVDETGKAAGFTTAGPGLFGTDVFLAAVYGIYLYTVLRMRMTQEFNRVVPPLPDLVRRLLGVYRLEV